MKTHIKKHLTPFVLGVAFAMAFNAILYTIEDVIIKTELVKHGR